MPQTDAKRIVKPLTELKRLLPKITHDELLDFTVAAQAELARRAVAYIDAVGEIEEPSRDLINEALVFALKANDLVPNRMSLGNRDVQDAWADIHHTISDLKAF